MVQGNIIVFLVGFALTILVAPLIIKLAKKIKAQQTILHYVKEHSAKQGTPTMGGIMFVLCTIVATLLFLKTDYMYAIITLAVFLAYAILGFLDDFIKVHYKQNLGLRAYQKIIGQLGISVIVAIFVYNTIGGAILLPFTNIEINLGAWIIPFIIVVYLATVNSVNLIDGLDGLSSVTSINYLFFFAVILMLSLNVYVGTEVVEMQNLLICIFALLGCLFAFLFFNIYPAKIFMGDTGSLALGGFIATISVLTKMELLIVLLGFVFVITAVSDILQVLHFKRTKKRIFKMAPLHHHFQMSGIHENKIVFAYFLFSFILNLVITAFYIL